MSTNYVGMYRSLGSLRGSDLLRKVESSGPLCADDTGHNCIGDGGACAALPDLWWCDNSRWCLDKRDREAVTFDDLNVCRRMR